MATRALRLILLVLVFLRALSVVAKDSFSQTTFATNTTFLSQGKTTEPEQPLTLWYSQPATKWVDALPLGNGRLGAMVFGGVEHERIQLNEDTIWNGQRRNRDNPEARKYVTEVRRLLFEGKPKEATTLE